jgi:hypothetical protein
MSYLKITKATKILRIVSLLLTNPTGVDIASIMDQLDMTRENSADLLWEIYTALNQFLSFDCVRNETEIKEESEKKRPSIKENDKLRLKDRPLNSVLAKIAQQAWLETPAVLTQVALELSDNLVDPEARKFANTVIAPKLDLSRPEESPPPIFNASRFSVNYFEFREDLKIFYEAIAKGVFCEVLYAKPRVQNDIIATFQESLFPRSGVTPKTPASQRYYDLVYFAPKEIVGYNGQIYIEGRRVKDLKTPLSDLGERSLALHRVFPGRTRLLTKKNEGLNLGLPRKRQEPLFGFIRTNPFILEANFAPRLATYLTERSISGLLRVSVVKGDKKDSLGNSFKGWIKLRVKCGDLDETLKWLLSFGSDVAIVSPKALKNLYRVQLLGMSKWVPGLKISRNRARKKWSPKPSSQKVASPTANDPPQGAQDEET